MLMPPRCAWVTDDPLYLAYHDEEWGVPVHDDQRLFEFLLLESFQAGLSWLTVLRKRENFRRAFDGFDPQWVAAYDEAKVQALLQDAGIIRNQQKIRAVITNAQVFLQLQGAFGSFDSYLWGVVDGQPVVNRWQTDAEVPVTSAVSDALSQDLKERGCRFVGSTIMYATMQAVGMVNDHVVGCFRHQELVRL